MGNPGLHLPTLIGGLAWRNPLITGLLGQKVGQLGVPPSCPDFVKVIADTRTGLQGFKASSGASTG